jgi:hypothetical protein
MTTYFSDNPAGKDHVPEFLTDDEQKALIKSFVHVTGKNPSFVQTKTMTDWATKVRIENALLNMVLEGELFTYCDDNGEMFFRNEEG